MPAINSATITRFFNTAEQQVSQEVDFLIDRISLNILPNVAIYTLPDYCRSIRRITYLGLKLDPLPYRNLRDVFGPGNQVSTPFWYIYSNVQQNSIQLFPIPGDTIPNVTNVWDSDIPNGCIVEFWRISDNSNFIMPPWARNQVCKRYVAKQTYTVEGASQNLKLAAYYEKQWILWKQRFSDRISDLYNTPRKLVINEVISSNYYPASPVLPIDRFGIGVDAGE